MRHARCATIAAVTDDPFSTEALLRAPEIRGETRAVRFQEVDAASTVFFPRLFEWASDNYIQWMRDEGVDIPAMLRARSFAAPLAHARSDFRRPLFFGDVARVSLVAARAGTTSFTLGHRVCAPDDVTALHAALVTVHVCVDPSTGRPVPLPEVIRAIFPTGA